MFKFIILFLCIFTVSCMQEPKTRDASDEYAIPIELQDCLFVKNDKCIWVKCNSY